MNDLFLAFGSQNTTTQFGAGTGWFLDVTDLSLIHQPLKVTIHVYAIQYTRFHSSEFSVAVTLFLAS